MSVNRAVAIAAAADPTELRSSYERAVSHGAVNTLRTPEEERAHGTPRLLTLATLRLPDLYLYAYLLEVLDEDATVEPLPPIVTSTLGELAAGLRLAHRALETHAHEVGYQPRAWVERALERARAQVAGDLERAQPPLVDQARRCTIAPTRAIAATAGERMLVPGEPEQPQVDVGDGIAGDSTLLETYGDPGPDQWITVYASVNHAFIQIGGIVLDAAHWTPTARTGSGPRWQPRSILPQQLNDGNSWTERHPQGYKAPERHSTEAFAARRRMRARNRLRRRATRHNPHRQPQRRRDAHRPGARHGPADWLDALGMYDGNDRSPATSRRLRRSAFGGERVNARGVRHRLVAQDSEMPAGHQVKLCAGDEAGSSRLSAMGTKRSRRSCRTSAGTCTSMSGRKTSLEPRRDGHRDPVVREPFVAERKLLTRMAAAEHRLLNNDAAR